MTRKELLPSLDNAAPRRRNPCKVRQSQWHLDCTGAGAPVCVCAPLHCEARQREKVKNTGGFAPGSCVCRCGRPRCNRPNTAESSFGDATTAARGGAVPVC